MTVRRFRLAAPLAGTVMATVLAACAATPPADRAEPVADTAATPPVADVEAARRPDPVEPPRSYPEPDALVDLGEPQLREILGEPGFVRRDPPAEIWQYRTGGCVLHLFFYADGDEQARALRHLEARRPEGGRLMTADCLRHVIDARPRQQAG